MSIIGALKIRNYIGSTFDSKNNTKNSTASNIKNSKEKNEEDNAMKIDPNDYVPKRFALRFNPPSIIVEYLVPSSGKLYHHKMRISNLKANSNKMEVFKAIQKKHSQYLEGDKISEAQITDLIEKLQKRLKEAPTGGSSENCYGENKISMGQKSGKLGTPNGKGNMLQAIDLNKDSTKNPKNSNEKNKSAKKGQEGNGLWDFEDLEDLKEDGSMMGTDESFDYYHSNLHKFSQQEIQKNKDKMNNPLNKTEAKQDEQEIELDQQEDFDADVLDEWDDEF